MFKTVLKRVSFLFPIAALCMASGCAWLDPINLLDAVTKPSSTWMDPDLVSLYRIDDCPDLEKSLLRVTNEPNNDPAYNKQWEINAINQVMAEKNCRGGGPAVNTPSGTAGMPGTSSSVSRGGGVIGVEMFTFTPGLINAKKDAYGNVGTVSVSWIDYGSSAKSAGIERGDTIMTVDGAPVASAQMVKDMIAGKQIGENVVLTIWRDKEIKSFTVKICTPGSW